LGQWKFKVFHFTKYGLDGAIDEDEENEEVQEQQSVVPII